MTLVQDWDKRKAFVCTIMDLPISYKAEKRLAPYLLIMNGNPSHEWLQSFQENKGVFYTCH
jgi:hypothetical protein